MKKITLALFLATLIFNVNANDSIPSKKIFNDLSITYSPSIVMDKTLFHGIEIIYSRKFSNWVALQFTQGFYVQKKSIGSWFDFDANNKLVTFNATRLDYFFNSFFTLQFIPIHKKIYEMRFGIGPSIYYRNTMKIKSVDAAYSFNEKYYDKGVSGGINLNLVNNFIIKKHFLLGINYNTQIIFPKGKEKLFIFSPGINVGYRF